MTTSTRSPGTGRSAVSTVLTGDIQYWSRTLIPTAKDAPSDAEAPSHKLLVRGGFIRRLAAGVYDYLPLGHRVLRKVEAIVREEMNDAGASELLLPALCPTELLHETGRADEYGDLLMRFNDRHGRDSYLGPTHEEVITELMRGTVSSYKQLPLNLYQIQTKYRDEFRPRAGLLRGREFLMKDAYSFHLSVDGAGGLGETYDAMYRAYSNVFARCGLNFGAVEAEAGPIGGSASHEFMVFCDTGEDTIMRCPETGYAANVEKCAIGERAWSLDGEPSGEAEDVHTPNCPGIEDVSKLLKMKTRNMLKSVVFRVKSTPEELEKYGEEWIVAVVRGDHEVNEGKVKKAAEVSAIELADPEKARANGFEIGYVSPRANLGKKGVLVVVDPDAAQGMDTEKGKPMFWVTGADRKDYHTKHFCWSRDLGKTIAEAMGGECPALVVADVRNAMVGDPSPQAPGAVLEAQRGIEVGHIFKLGTKYSEAMGYRIMGEDQVLHPVIMGCYGIGVSRTMAAAVEMSHDENGIVWPMALAPYHVLITVMKPEDGAAMEATRSLAAELSGAGFDVLIDDRNERPGFKFKDADLIGVPIRLTVGDKGLAEQSVEFKLRSDAGKGELVKLSEVVERCEAAAMG
ncbi:MAG: proline--tRNA ligase [Phycisphaerales bacterium]